AIRHALTGAGGADEIAAFPAAVKGLGSVRCAARVLEHDLAVVGAAAARPHAGPFQSVALDRLGMTHSGTVEALGSLLGAAIETVVVFAAALVRAAGSDVHAPQGTGAVAFEDRRSLTTRRAVETASAATRRHAGATFRAEGVAHPLPRLGRPLRLGQRGQ